MKKQSNCPLCGADRRVTAYHITRTDPDFEVSRCLACGHLYMDPPPDEKTLASLYEEGYYDGSAAFSYTDERNNRRGFQAVARARIRKILRSLHIKNGNGAGFLDVGCSFGSLLDAAAEAGFTATGLDISNYAVEYVNKQGHTAIRGIPETATLPREKFAAITMVEVIEHLRDPKKALMNLFRATAPGGLILIQTANMDGRQARKAGAEYHYFLPGHLQYFNRRRLTSLLAECGFCDVRCHYPCEFGLLPKLKKSRGEFRKFRDYLRWFRISWYHLKSKIHLGNFALTSGMVLTARKPKT